MTWAAPSHANNAECRRNDIHDTESPHVSRTALTERLFVRRRGATICTDGIQRRDSVMG
jgi:hypothetical protein